MDIKSVYTWFLAKVFQAKAGSCTHSIIGVECKIRQSGYDKDFLFFFPISIPLFFWTRISIHPFKYVFVWITKKKNHHEVKRWNQYDGQRKTLKELRGGTQNPSNVATHPLDFYTNNRTNANNTKKKPYIIVLENNPNKNNQKSSKPNYLEISHNHHWCRYCLHPSFHTFSIPVVETNYYL